MPIRSPLLFPISSSLSFTAAGGIEPLLVFVRVCVSFYLHCVRLWACVSFLASNHLQSRPSPSAPGHRPDVEPGEKLESVRR